MSKPCPCNPKIPFSSCCEPILKGEKRAPTAEALMRSRYSAYVLGHSLYLLKTVHPFQVHPETINTAVEATLREIKWTGLDILKTDQGMDPDSQGMVEYIASYTLKGEPFTLHEKSQFIKMEGEWKYTTGEIIEK